MISRDWFVWSLKNNVEVGTRVRNLDSDQQGIVTLIWYGVEESLNVKLDNGKEVTWYPAERLDNVEVIR